MKFKIILLLSLSALCYGGCAGMNLLSGEIEAASGKITEGATTLNQALEGVVLKLGALAEETLEQLGNQAAFKARQVTSAAILGVADGVRASFSGKTGNTIPAGSTIPDSVISGVNTILERIVMGFGGDKGSTIPEAINLVKNSMKSKCYNIGKKALIVGAAVGTTIVAYYLFKKLTHPGSLNKCNLNKSNLLVESSGFKNGVCSRIATLFKRNEPLKKMILAPTVANKASEILKNFMHTVKSSGSLYFKSLLLEGPKGTGKTLFIDHLIRFSKLDYIKTNSSSFINFNDGSESQAVATLFNLLKNPKKPIVIVIEEADILLNRSGYKTRILDLIKWLKSNKHKFMLILSAENKNLLDAEVLHLMDQSLELAMPTEQERKKLLMHNLSLVTKEQGNTGFSQIINSVLNIEKIEEIAKKTEGFSYSKIQLLFDDLKMELLRSNNSFTKELANDIVLNGLEQKVALTL